jgi:hypothetical protein
MNGTPLRAWIGKGIVNCCLCPAKIKAHPIPSVAAIVLKHAAWRRVATAYVCPVCQSQRAADLEVLERMINETK